MGCCGSRTMAYPVAAGSAGGSDTSRPRETSRPNVVFQYIGKTRLIVIGPVTGIQYRFRGPGAHAMVDVRDQWSLDRVPNLSKLVDDDRQP